MKRSTQLLLGAVKFAAEMAMAACWLFAIAWGLGQLAEYRQNLPIRPDGDGTVTLAAPQATLHGQLRLFPTDLEDRTEGYGNEYGRELVKERENRIIGDWNGIDDFAVWEFRLNRPGTYEVSLELAAPDDAGGKILVTVGEQTVGVDVPATGGPDTWKSIPLFPVHLPVGIHVLAIKPESIRGHSLMNLARVTLRPVEAEEQREKP